MTEPGSFAPPSGALTPRQPGPTPLPPPTGQPIGTGAPLASPPPPRRRWIAPVVIGGSLLFVGLVAGVVALAIQLGAWLGDGPGGGFPTARGDELVEGEPGSPIAEEPVECTACFGMDDVEEIIPDEAPYAAMGLHPAEGDDFRTHLGADQKQLVSWWEQDGGTPSECFFTYPAAPLEFSAETLDPDRYLDRIYYRVAHTDDTEYLFLNEGFRAFPDSATASAHLTSLVDAVDGCPVVAFPELGSSSAVHPAPALDLPPSVAAYGWTETAGTWRYYAFDLQRGNLVVRVSLSSDTGGPSESEFRAFVEAYAEALAGLEPRP
jgi:hypothetical protein